MKAATLTEVLETVLIAHQRLRISQCSCGWRELGQSHAHHVATFLIPVIEAWPRWARPLEVRR